MSGLGYRPGLDGLRGIALASVLLFHAELGDHGSLLEWVHMPGAWGGVSTFFTLSGFLICALLLREHDESGSISLKAFYARRARRLLPALLLTLAGVVVFAATVADSSQLRNLRGDVLASLAYVANWRFGLGTTSYADLFASPSPVLHFWTVAIEEQFYLLFPPALGLALTRRRGRDPLTVLLLAYGGFAAVQVASGLAGASEDLIYFGTHTRAAELLAGAALAAAVHTGRHRALLPHLHWAGPAALAAMITIWATVEQGSDLLYRGGFAAYAGLSVIAVLAAATPGNPLEAVLRREPLRTLGQISYGVYLFHWPIYRWLTPERTELDDAPLLLVRLALAIGAGWLSYHLLEHPVRRGRLVRGNQIPIALGAALALIIAGTIATTVDPTDDQLTVSVGPPVATWPNGDEFLPPSRMEAGPGLRISLFGDSVAQSLGLGLGEWANGSDPWEGRTVAGGAPGVIGINGYTSFGCGLLGSVRMEFRGEEVPVSERGCGDWRAGWQHAVDLGDPDLAVISGGPWAVTNLELPGDDRLRHIGDPLVDEALLREMNDAVDLFLDQDIEVVWVLAPHIDAGTIDGVRPSTPFPESEPSRIDRYNELVRQVVAQHPGRATTIDLPGYLASLPGGEMDVTVRPDLIHYTVESSTELARSWLGPAILAAAEEVGAPTYPT